MTDTLTMPLGAYREGIVPPPIVVTFEDANGNPIDLTHFTARLEYRHSGDAIVKRTAVIDADQVANRGQVRYTWVAADFTAVGAHQGELWVGNGSNRYASIYLLWFVTPSLAGADSSYTISDLTVQARTPVNSSDDCPPVRSSEVGTV